MKFIALIMIGDLHHKWSVILDFIKKFEITQTCFFQVGDFGVGFDDNEEKCLEILNDFLKQTNNFLYVIRGNHDKPSFFNGSYTTKYSNICLLPDYSIITVEIDEQPITILGIGGAISTDKYNRELNVDYWEDEYLHVDINHLSLLDNNINVVVTHTAPDFVEPFVTSIPAEKIGEIEMQRIKEERENLSIIFEKIIKNNPFLKFAFYGHFHFSSQTEYKNIQFNLLGINEFKEVRL